MNLLTNELERRFAEVGSQEHLSDPIVIAKFFNPTGGGTWYAIQYDPEKRDFFGYGPAFADLVDEWGTFSFDYLSEIIGPLGLGIERDIHFVEQPISKVCPESV